MDRFQKMFRLTETTRVLDVGGSPEIWRLAVQPNLTMVNVPRALAADHSVPQVGADGCLLPFRDDAFDVVFSNSVIEYVGSVDDQRKFAAEVARVGRSFWVQTPNRGFPVESHMLLPFVHQLPERWRPAIVNRFTGWELLFRPTESQKQYYLHHFLHELRLLSASDLQSLFPNSEVIREKVFGLTKSLIAVRICA
ncbi:MAG TPA: methyltransferase domain-containing protein [Bryobacteraceae bacterium]|nr:methyltransferase domain-containing protein [Bryobacteraceae bacterium]